MLHNLVSVFGRICYELLSILCRAFVWYELGAYIILELIDNGFDVYSDGRFPNFYRFELYYRPALIATSIIFATGLFAPNPLEYETKPIRVGRRILLRDWLLFLTIHAAVCCISNLAHSSKSLTGILAISSVVLTLQFIFFDLVTLALRILRSKKKSYVNPTRYKKSEESVNR